MALTALCPKPASSSEAPSELVLTGVLTYVCLQVVFGFAVARRIKSEEDYLLGGRRIGPTLATFTIFATWFGAETCIGAASQAYAGGLSSIAVEPFGYGLCLLLMGVAFAGPLWRLRLTTLADLFRRRFGTTAEWISVILMVPTSILWAAAQIRAFGQILAATSSLEVQAAIAIAAVVVIVYTALGGFLADAVSDLVQGLVLAAGLVIIAVSVLLSGDGGNLLSLPTERLRLAAGESSPLDLLELFAVPIVGSVFAQELVARVIAARNPAVARRSTVTASGLYLFVGLIPVALGLLAAASAIELDHPEQILVHMAGRALPGALYVIFAGALVSAILSTVDSALLVSGSLLAHNLLLPLFPTRGERFKVRVNRSAVVASGVVAYLLTRSQASVWDLVIEASGFGSAGIFVAVMFALYTRFGGKQSAVGCLLSGLAVYVVAAHVLALDHPFLLSLACSLGAYLLLALPIFGRTPLSRADTRSTL